ncbi:MAG: hypothetical protein ABI036_08765 [Fibrobacteria bacterium]
MKAEIQQILQMNKAGTITDEQAAELLAELARKDRNGDHEKNTREPKEGAESGPVDWDPSGFVEPILSKVNDTVKSALDAAFGPKGHHGSGERPGGWAMHGSWRHGRMGGFADRERSGGMDGNAIHMSRFDFPRGKDYTFLENAIRMSSVRNVRMERAEMTRNTIDMSKVDGVQVLDGKVRGCEIRASSVEDWNLAGTVANAVSIQGSKVEDFHCREGVELDNLRIQGASLKDFGIIGPAKLAEVRINGSTVADVKIIRTSIARGEIQGSQLVDVFLEGCEVKELTVRLLSLLDAAFTACAFQDVVFSGSDKWLGKRMGFKDVRMDNCRMDKVLFSNCKLTGVVLKNITLRDRQFRDLELTGLTLDGDEAFLRAAGASPA